MPMATQGAIHIFHAWILQVILAGAVMRPSHGDGKNSLKHDSAKERFPIVHRCLGRGSHLRRLFWHIGFWHFG